MNNLWTSCEREKKKWARSDDGITSLHTRTKRNCLPSYMVLCYAKLAERKQRYWWQYRYIVSSIIVWYIVDWYGPDRAFLSLRSGQQTILCASIEFPCFRSYRTCDEYMANWAKSLSFFLFFSPVKGYNQRLLAFFLFCVCFPYCCRFGGLKMKPIDQVDQSCLLEAWHPPPCRNG